MNGFSGAQGTDSRLRERVLASVFSDRFVWPDEKISVLHEQTEGTGAARVCCPPIIPCLTTCRGRDPIVQVIQREPRHMHNIIYLIGLIVVVLAILSFLGLR